MPRARKAEAVVIVGFGARVTAALDRYERRLGVRKLSDEAFRDVMRVALGNPKLAVSTVGRWRAGKVPDTGTIATIAQVCGVDPGWLAFGGLSAAPAPAEGPRSGHEIESAPFPGSRPEDGRAHGHG